MTTQLEAICQQQKDSWNKISIGWKKWDHMTMDFLKPMGDEIIRTLNLKEDDIVLDVAGGTGGPGLTIATMLTSGKVYITDIAENMVDIARENANNRGIENVEAITAELIKGSSLKPKESYILLIKRLRKLHTSWGYEAEYYFSRFFKVNTNVSPQKYRETVAYARA